MWNWACSQGVTVARAGLERMTKQVTRVGVLSAWTQWTSERDNSAWGGGWGGVGARDRKWWNPHERYSRGASVALALSWIRCFHQGFGKCQISATSWQKLQQEPAVPVFIALIKCALALDTSHPGTVGQVAVWGEVCVPSQRRTVHFRTDPGCRGASG